MNIFFLGVDIFLVLSGYLLALKISKYKDEFNRLKLFKEIFIKRAKKLFIPLLFFLIIFSVPLMGFFPYPALTAQSSIYSLLFLQNIRLIRSSFNYFNNANIDFFNHLWYLSVDFQIILFISIVVIILLKKRLVNISLFIIFFASFF
tara:strand:- start:572 stop:1012 length:441 start_codon:yes stop_codon:yes gene_type:complete